MDIIYILLIINAILGLLVFEWAWYKFKPVRKIDEERDSQYPAYRRYDVKYLKKWWFYLGAITIMLPRMIVNYSLLFFVYFYLRLVMIGVNLQEGIHLHPIRMALAKYVMQFFGWIQLFISGLLPRFHNLEYDYSHYLGPDYRSDIVLENQVSTIISNHSYWADQYLLMLTRFFPSFCAKQESRDIPVFGFMAQMMNCIFVARESSKEQKLLVIEQIIERQTQIEETGRASKLAIFPEGGTSNGQYLLSFKKGAFVGLKPIIPIVFQYQWKMISHAYDIVPPVPLLILICCQFWIELLPIQILPPFKPNQFLFDKYKDMGKEKWEIYAWALRDIIAKVGNFQKNDQRYVEKLQYESMLGYIKFKLDPVVQEFL